MWFTQKFIVRKHERGLLFKDGDFIKFLAPGTYRYFGLRSRYAVERYDLSVAAFEHRLADYLVEAERARAALDRVDRPEGGMQDVDVAIAVFQRHELSFKIPQQLFAFLEIGLLKLF